MKKKTKTPVSADTERKEMIPLNAHLVSDFSIEELEERLETDPLMLSQVFGITTNDGGNNIEPLCACKKLSSCPELACICRGGYQEPPICSPVCEFSVDL